MSVNAGESVVGVYVGEELLTGSGLPETFTLSFDSHANANNDYAVSQIDTLGYKYVDITITTSTNGGAIQGFTTENEELVTVATFNSGASSTKNHDISNLHSIRTAFTKGSVGQTAVNTGTLTLHN